MFCKMFIYSFISIGLYIFVGLYGMVEKKEPKESLVAHKPAGEISYSAEDSILIDFVFLKAMEKMSILDDKMFIKTNIDGSSIQTIDFKKIPYVVRNLIKFFCGGEFVKPSISAKNFFNRTKMYMHCSSECFVSALIYINRFVKQVDSAVITEQFKIQKKFDWNKDVVFNNYSFHRIFFLALMLAAKFWNDKFYNNTYYKDVCGVKLNELSVLEKLFLYWLNYKLYISKEEYDGFVAEIKEFGKRLRYCREDLREEGKKIGLYRDRIADEIFEQKCEEFLKKLIDKGNFLA